MDIFKSLKNGLFKTDQADFKEFALELFQIQAKNNILYQEYVRQLKVDPSKVTELEDIPYLPIEFFKRFQLKTGQWNSKITFESSGTTSAKPSTHYVPDPDFYNQVCAFGFERLYGPLTDYHILALLPSYLERGNSSLVVMVAHFIKKSGSTHSGFYLADQEALIERLDDLINSSSKVLLLGVSFALLDLAEIIEPRARPNLIVMETGGMKGRRAELVREDLHLQLAAKFGVKEIHSEYGMTELFSQAYSTENGIFESPPWMRIIIREILDPFQKGLVQKTGGINVIDLANFHSCAFIETQDLGVAWEYNRFAVLGRMDNSDLRGCNLLVN